MVANKNRIFDRSNNPVLKAEKETKELISTGLVDKFGVDINQRDVLKKGNTFLLVGFGEFGITDKNNHYVCSVIGFYVEDQTGIQYPLELTPDMEVVGNLDETPQFFGEYFQQDNDLEHFQS